MHVFESGSIFLSQICNFVFPIMSDNNDNNNNKI